MSRESVAKAELDKAEMCLRNAKNEILNATDDLTKYGSAISEIFSETQAQRRASGVFGIVSGAF